MGYEIFARKSRRMGSPAISFNTNGVVTFNKSAALKLRSEAVENVLLLWDSDQHKLGIRRIGKKDDRSYHVHYGKRDNGAGFSGKTFLDHIGFDFTQTRSFPAIWNENEAMFEVEVSPDCLSSSKQPRLLPVESRAHVESTRKAK